MIFYERFRFATPPRTGSVWFVEAVVAIGMAGPVYHTAVVHEPFPPVPYDPTKLPRVTLVRHPCDWLASLWGSIYPQRVCEPMNELCSLADGGAFETFDDFIRAMLDWRPGAVGEIFSWFAAEFYLRTDYIRQDLYELCQSLGISVRGKFPPPRNLRSVQVQWDSDLWAQVVKSEREWIERHGLVARR